MGLLDLFRSKPQPAPQQPQQSPAVLTEQLQRYDQAFRQLTESNEFPNLFASLYDRYYSNGTWWIPAGGIPMLGGTSNKYQGRDAYISIHEQDNRLIVDACRLLYAREPVAKSIVNYLQCFVLGSGLTYKLCSKKEDAVDESILEAGQEYIDEWCERNEQTEREHECFECSIVDGEFFLWMKVYNGEVVVRRIEPEFIRNPPNMAMEQGWFFGVKYDPLDMETPLAYWYEPPMSKGQEIPADEIIHYKANVTKNVARGVSDFFPVLDDLNGIAGLIDNIRAGATARAEIAYMYSIANATQGAISDFASARRDRTAQNPITNRTDSFKGMSAGKVVYHGQNASFQTMPQGDVQSYIEAAQQSLRLIGNRWCMPEYMVSADASNNNYASSLIAGGPFVRKIEYVQKRFGTSMKRLMEAVVNQAIAGKVIPARYLPMLKVEVTAHSPVIEDKYQQAQTYDIYTRMGAMSVESVASKIGEDYEKVQAENEEHADRMLDQQVAQNDALGGNGQQDSGNGGFAESFQENTLDDSGHMHKGKGPGGGQFTSKDSGSNDGKFADKGGDGESKTNDDGKNTIKGSKKGKAKSEWPVPNRPNGYNDWKEIANFVDEEAAKAMTDNIIASKQNDPEFIKSVDWWANNHKNNLPTNNKLKKREHLLRLMAAMSEYESDELRAINKERREEAVKQYAKVNGIDIKDIGTISWNKVAGASAGMDMTHDDDNKDAWRKAWKVAIGDKP